MSVDAEMGRRILAEIEEDRLDKILLRLSNRILATQQIPIFNIHPLDSIVTSVRPIPPPIPAPRPLDEFLFSSTPQLQSHQPDRNSIRSPDPRPGPFIELLGNASGSGKTSLLYLVTTLAILPSDFQGIRLSGLSATVVVLDTDGRFDTQRLAQVIHSHVTNCISESSLEERIETTEPPEAQPPVIEDSIKALISTSLAHVHIFRPQSLASTLATLSSIPTYLLNASAHRSANRRLHSIILDSASTFLWNTRAEEDIARLDPSPNFTNQPASHANLVAALRRVSGRLGCAVISTSWVQRDGASDGGRSIMPAVWETLADIKIMVARKSVPPFAPMMSVEQAISEQDQRIKVVERGRFEGWVLGRERQHGSRFEFTVDGNGVRFIDEDAERATVGVVIDRPGP